MLKGKVVTLRPAQEEDLQALYEHTLDLENRGEFYPASIRTLPEMKKDFALNGFWSEEWGLLLIFDTDTSNLIGQIAWFKTVQYLSELEIGYIMYDKTARTRGGMTEACKLLTRYLFHTKPVNRVRLCIATQNGPSRRVAEKSGYLHEGTQRGAWWNDGKIYDMELYAATRQEWTSRES